MEGGVKGGVGVGGPEGLVRGQGPLPLGEGGGRSCLLLPLGSHNCLQLSLTKVRTIVSLLFV